MKDSVLFPTKANIQCSKRVGNDARKALLCCSHLIVVGRHYRCLGAILEIFAAGCVNHFA